MPPTELKQNLPENHLARHAYISGLAGLMIILAMGFFAAVNNVMDGGWHISSFQLTASRHHSSLFVLGICALVMFVIEMAIRLKKEKKVITISPKLKEKRIAVFLIECALNYALDLAVLFMAVFFFHHANEYGFAADKQYYRPFFALLRIFWELYLLCGFPYVVLTRALQYNPEADRREPAYLLLKVLGILYPWSGISNILKKYDLLDIKSDVFWGSLGSFDGKILLGIFVKMFFVPLMTVFFFEQFTHLVLNWSYIVNLVFGVYRNMQFTVLDLYNVSFTIIFAIDVGLAWCGYTISTRWLKNTCVSVEPTILGWIVALLCYPPFQQYITIYFSIPSEKGFLSIPHPWLVGIFAIMSILSYIVYMSATVAFGMRFSNLTHRGIITTGPYAFIRHPAYAAKNFSWWCVMMPYVLYQAFGQNSAMALLQIFGLLGMTGLYYLRAITEERHLSIDPAYVEYCKKVPYRFIPGIL